MRHISAGAMHGARQGLEGGAVEEVLWQRREHGQERGGRQVLAAKSQHVVPRIALAIPHKCRVAVPKRLRNCQGNSPSTPWHHSFGKSVLVMPSHVE